MGLDCGASLIKYVLFIFNLICAVGGIALVVVGAIGLRTISNVEDLFKDSNHPGIYPAAIIALGVLVFIIAFFGCCGAIRESQCLLNMYALCLLVLVVLQVLLAIFVFMYNEDIQKGATQVWDRIWTGNSNDINKKTIDNFQRFLKCCGSSGPTDYLVSQPPSCCEPEAQSCNVIYAYKTGCRSQIQSEIQYGAKWIAYLSLAMAVIELIGVVFGCCLSSNIRNSSRYE